MVPAAAAQPDINIGLAFLVGALILGCFVLAMRVIDERADLRRAEIDVRYLLSVLRDRNDLALRLLEGSGAPPDLVAKYRETFDKELDVVRKPTGRHRSRPPVE